MKTITTYKRVIDKDLLKRVREQPCLICLKKGVIDPHHITPVGAGGGDVEKNVIPLCRPHHQEIHKIGLTRFMEKYWALKRFLEKHNRDDILSRVELWSKNHGK